MQCLYPVNITDDKQNHYLYDGMRPEDAEIISYIVTPAIEAIKTGVIENKQFIVAKEKKQDQNIISGWVAGAFIRKASK